MEQRDFALADRIAVLETALQHSWSFVTSADFSRWSTENPAYGQAAPTSLVVLDHLGGEIIYANVAVADRTVAHFYNQIGDQKVDLTASQFSSPIEETKIIGLPSRFESMRDYIFSFQGMETRYNLLKDKVEAYLQEHQ